MISNAPISLHVCQHICKRGCKTSTGGRVEQDSMQTHVCHTGVYLGRLRVFLDVQLSNLSRGKVTKLDTSNNRLSAHIIPAGGMDCEIVVLHVKQCLVRAEQRIQAT